MVTPKGEEIDTGNYLLHIRLNKSIPNILPIYSLKIIVSYDGIKKQLKTFFSFHKNESKCKKSHSSHTLMRSKSSIIHVFHLKLLLKASLCSNMNEKLS